jgi:hypothetical protein
MVLLLRKGHLRNALSITGISTLIAVLAGSGGIFWLLSRT